MPQVVLRSERIGQAGRLMLCNLARSDDDLPDDFFEAQLAAIEEQIHGRENRVRYAMSSALAGGRARLGRQVD